MPEAQANMMICYVIGRWHQYAKSGFKRKPTNLAEQQLSML
jgi:TetR/AcrR family transcriptional regulator